MQFHQELLKLGALVVEIDREYYYDVIALFKVHNYVSLNLFTPSLACVLVLLNQT